MGKDPFTWNSFLAVPQDPAYRLVTREWTFPYHTSPIAQMFLYAKNHRRRKAQVPTQIDAAATQVVTAQLRIERTPQVSAKTLKNLENHFWMLLVGSGE